MSSTRPAGPADPDTFALLEEERDFLLASLEDLEREHDAGDIEDHDYAALKDDYTARAAGVLRAIEDGNARYAEAQAPGGWKRPTAIVGVVALLAIGAGVLVAQGSGSRTTGEATGEIRLSTRDKLLQAQAQILDDPVAALMLYDEVLEVQPENVEALTYRGWTLALAQQGDLAIEWLDRAVEADPAYPDARAFRAIVLGNTGEPAAALDDLDTLDADELPAEVQGLVEGLRTRLEAQVGAATP